MNLDLARLQFAITTIYHFLFVPVSIGMAAYVAHLPDAVLADGHVRSMTGWPASGGSCS